MSITTSLLLAATLLGAPLTEKQIVDGADARIEQHRKADAELKLVGADGKPLAGGTDVKIEQTRHAFLFGSNIFKLNRCKTPEDNAAYARQFADLLNFATIPFYWWSYESKPGQYADARTEMMIAFCQEHHITTKGHPLAWNWFDPKWLPDDMELVKDAQFRQIRRSTQRFGYQIPFFDVVNEATHYSRPDSRRAAPKLTRMVREMGVGPYLRTAFKAARLGNPDTQLIINDYVTTEGYADKVLEELVDEENKPMYDVIGIQSHQHGGAWPITKVWEICDRFARYGVPLHFTETTFLSGEQGWDIAKKRRKTDPKFRWISTPEGEKRQADDVVRFYTTLFSHPAVEAITWWDFTDQGSWQQAPCGLLRADMTPKPAYEELMKRVKGTWWTQASAKVDDTGVAHFRGLLGDYKVSVTHDDKTLTGTFTLAKDTEGMIEVKLR